MSTETVRIFFNMFWVISLTQFLLNLLTLISHLVESTMIRVVQWYDVYYYTPLEKLLLPWLTRIPRSIEIREKNIIIFTANIVTYTRTFLLIPIAWSLKCRASFFACGFVLLHAFLDHVSGWVGKIQKKQQQHDDDEDEDVKTHDPFFNDFLNENSNQLANFLSIWTILQTIQLDETSIFISLAFVFLCYTTIGIEIAVGSVRVKEYFYAIVNKNKKSSDAHNDMMEGKVKQTIQSIGIACLCLSTRHIDPFDHWSGAFGVICLFLTVRLAYVSLLKSIEIEKQMRRPKKTVTIDKTNTIHKTIAVFNAFQKSSDENETRPRALTLDSSDRENEKRSRSNTPSSVSSSCCENPMSNLMIRTPTISENLSENDEDQHPTVYQRSASLPAIWIDGRADKVYTVGCFDLFHDGHRILLQRMRQFGREVIVGVHDSRSIHKLKSRVPVDGTETRMLNVKRYADEVYCVAGTDPSNFIKCIVHLRENETAVYVRGDDMAEFPSRKVVEELMPVKFLPYTNGVSSTQLRKELFSHIGANDVEHLERVN